MNCEKLNWIDAISIIMQYGIRSQLNHTCRYHLNFRRNSIHLSSPHIEVIKHDKERIVLKISPNGDAMQIFTNQIFKLLQVISNAKNLVLMTSCLFTLRGRSYWFRPFFATFLVTFLVANCFISCLDYSSGRSSSDKTASVP